MAFLTILLAVLLPVALVALYVFLNDRALKAPPAPLLFLLDTGIENRPVNRRWTREDMDKAAAEEDKDPIFVKDQLGSATGRRYIVTGGAGFVGGYIVKHLLARGERPQNIRILDMRPPTRKDLLQGPAKECQVVQVDLTNAQAVTAAFQAKWPEGADISSEITVFHTAAIIRFFDRIPALLPLSVRVNLGGTQNVVDACKAIGATVLIATSSCTAGLYRPATLIWPFRTAVDPSTRLFQIINDETVVPETHAEACGSYPHTKLLSERIVTAADKSKTTKGGVLRTGAIRPGNAIYGPGSDCFEYNFFTGEVIGFINHVWTNYVYVENVSLSHLCYERRLIELAAGGSNPDIGGQAFLVTDSGPITKLEDLHNALCYYSKGAVKMSRIPVTFLLLLGHCVEKYILLRLFLLNTPLSFLVNFNLLPPMTGQLHNLQPNTCALGLVHQILDDKRARLSPEKGGLGYNPPWDTIHGVYKTVRQYYDDGALSPRKGNEFGFAK